MTQTAGEGDDALKKEMEFMKSFFNNKIMMPCKDMHYNIKKDTIVLKLGRTVVVDKLLLVSIQRFESLIPELQSTENRYELWIRPYSYFTKESNRESFEEPTFSEEENKLLLSIAELFPDLETKHPLMNLSKGECLDILKTLFNKFT